MCVYCQPPRPAGRRGLSLTKSPVQVCAEELGLAVRTPASLKSAEEQKNFVSLNADVAVVVAYGLLLPPSILKGTRLGCFNAHASLLPRWRGAAPIHRAIMAGDAETGMMVMKMDEGLDTGPLAMTKRVSIAPNMTTGELHDVLKSVGAELMTVAMQSLEDGELVLRPQSENGIMYAKKIDKEEARIDWTRQAIQVHRQVCGLSPFPGAWCEMEIGGKIERVKILKTRVIMKEVTGHLIAPCADGLIEILELQRAGGKAMNALDFLRGVGAVKIY